MIIIMNANKGRFGSVRWIKLTCTETIVNAVVFTLLILYDLTKVSNKRDAE